MRAFFFSVSFFLATAAAASACPELDGHFTCTYDGKYGQKVFELDGQTLHDDRGETYYVVNQKEIYTDGAPHHTDSLPILDQWADDVNYTATCTGENVIHITGDARVKKYNMRADLDGDLTKQADGALIADFRVNMAFFGADIQVPCEKKVAGE